MKKPDAEDVSLPGKASEGARVLQEELITGGKLEIPLTLRAKNGLVNGVSERKKSKANKKLNVNNTSNMKNCVSSDTSLNIISNDDLKQSKLCQSNSKTTGTMISNKTESKRKKNRTRNKSERVPPIEQSNALPINEMPTSMSSVSEIVSSEMPSTSSSQLNSDQISSFEQSLIDSLRDLQIPQQDDNVATSNLEGCALSNLEEILCDITYVQYESELQMPMIMRIIQKDLSEPYSIYTYRYFIHNWPKLCFLAMCEEKCVGAIVCKLDFHRKSIKRGYIAMLAVDKEYRKRKIGSTLVRRAITEMILGEADEVVLETEVTNKPALRLYEQLGFVRDKRLFRYYLNGVDALRLKLWLR